MTFYRIIVIMVTLMLAVDLLYALLQTFRNAGNVSTLLLLNAAVLTYFSNYTLWNSGKYIDEHNLTGEPMLFVLNLLNIFLFIALLLLYLRQFRKSAPQADKTDD